MADRVRRGHRDANMNMVRVWGGGVYLTDLVLRIPRRTGLLVWQDFMFACVMVPDDEDFRQRSRSTGTS